MRLCMFSPRGHDLERGWPGRVDGDEVVQLAAQTLQAYFTGGGQAREHDRFPLAEVELRAPVLHPPSVRIFDAPDRFEFANPAAILSPGAEVAGEVEVLARVTAVVGADGAIGGWTLMADCRAPDLSPPKDRDFALVLGPVVTTERIDGFDWDKSLELAKRNTRLCPGDLLVAPPHDRAGTVVHPAIGELYLRVTRTR
ncbi:MAG: hypothetical protein WD689_08200 [Gaiellaceae bacterium]